ncbi:MAG: hypothetical protein M1827_005192 [Pycnora praestabilis]|nr:MAG: hypothetical protein M1827_005192 [Pycnora praestabilis]
MAPLSSPVAYPLSSSPPAFMNRKKRPVQATPPIPHQRVMAGFLIGDEEDGDSEEAMEATHHGSIAQTDGARDVPPEYAGDEIYNWTKLRSPIPRGDEVTEPHASCSLGNSITAGSLVATRPAISTSSSALCPTKLFQSSKRKSIARTCCGTEFGVSERSTGAPVSFEQLIAARSAAAPGRARKSYYGIDIHRLLDDTSAETQKASIEAAKTHVEPPLPSIEEAQPAARLKNGRTLMWTEKYRARKFTDLVGDERTHRSVLRWLKGWDPIVFPRSGRVRALASKHNIDSAEERPHRKILLLTGPPGLGKTTLAHVCARQAGYEILEINASDERSRDVVKGRIRDSVGTENVKGINTKTADGNVRTAGRPVCVVVDEVDGVAGGSSSGGEGGFMKALIDLLVLDQQNSNTIETRSHTSTTSKRKIKGDNFRLLRPLIMICNDVYHPALRPLRQSNMAEIIHIRKPPLHVVVSRMKTIFEREHVPCDADGVRRLCEATWGINSRREAGSSSTGSGDGDIRGIMVVGEWVARKLRASVTSHLPGTTRLTLRWIEEHILSDLSHGGGAARGLGRGGAKEVVERVFVEGAGFPKPIDSGLPDDMSSEPNSKIGVAELGKRRAIDRLREMVDSSGESEKIVTDCYTSYPKQPFQDDTLLSKPNAAYEWLHFHDILSSKVYSGQEWELNPYISQSILAFHQLFASPIRHAWSDQGKFGEDEEEDLGPFTGPKADFAAFEAQKQNRAMLLALQSSLSIPLLRSFRSPEDIATDLLPHVVKMLTPDVKPVIVGGSGDQRGIASVRKEGEREMVRRAVGVMSSVGVSFERGRVETEQGGYGGFVYRMEPPLDILASYETATVASGSATAPVRYAVRQVLDQEYQKDLILQRAEARRARYKAGGPTVDVASNLNDKENRPMQKEGKVAEIVGAKRDFFGRIINEARPSKKREEVDDGSRKKRKGTAGERDHGEENKVWVSFHEGFSNAVRKPITLDELMRGL